MKSTETRKKVEEAFLLALYLLRELDKDGLVTEENLQTLSELVDVLGHLESRLTSHVMSGITEGEFNFEQSWVVDEACVVIEQIFCDAAEYHWDSEHLDNAYKAKITYASKFYDLPREGARQARYYYRGRISALYNHLLSKPIDKDGKRYFYWLDTQTKESSDIFYEGPIPKIDF